MTREIKRSRRHCRVGWPPTAVTISLTSHGAMARTALFLGRPLSFTFFSFPDFKVFGPDQMRAKMAGSHRRWSLTGTAGVLFTFLPPAGIRI